MNTTITIDMDRRCAECHKGGATQNGLCLRCITRAVEGRVMRTRVGIEVQKRILANLRAEPTKGGTKGAP